MVMLGLVSNGGRGRGKGHTGETGEREAWKEKGRARPGGKGRDEGVSQAKPGGGWTL